MGRSRVVLRYHCRREEREQARVFFFSSRRRHTRWNCDWSSDVCSSDLNVNERATFLAITDTISDAAELCSVAGLGRLTPASRESKLVRKARMVNPQLQNGTALVTGGGRGIGRSISEKLAKLGLTVVITGRDQNLLERTAEAIQSAGGKCRPLAFDITDLT